MFSAVGWVRVEEAEYLDEFGDPASYPRPETIHAVGAAILRIAPSGDAALLREYNLVHTVLIDRHHNHRSSWPLDLFHEIARVAPGSFGFLHIYDDEHPDEHHRFMKWSMVHGKISVEEDLSLVPAMRTWQDGHDRRGAH